MEDTIENDFYYLQQRVSSDIRKLKTMEAAIDYWKSRKLESLCEEITRDENIDGLTKRLIDEMKKVLQRRIITFIKGHYETRARELDVETEMKLSDKVEMIRIELESLNDQYPMEEALIEEIVDEAQKKFEATSNRLSEQNRSLKTTRVEGQLENEAWEKELTNRKINMAFEEAYSKYNKEMNLDQLLCLPVNSKISVASRQIKALKLALAHFDTETKRLDAIGYRSKLELLIDERYKVIKRSHLLLFLQDKAHRIVQKTVDFFQKTVNQGLTHVSPDQATAHRCINKAEAKANDFAGKLRNQLLTDLNIPDEEKEGLEESLEELIEQQLDPLIKRAITIFDEQIRLKLMLVELEMKMTKMKRSHEEQEAVWKLEKAKERQMMQNEYEKNMNNCKKVLAEFRQEKEKQSTSRAERPQTRTPNTPAQATARRTPENPFDQGFDQFLEAMFRDEPGRPTSARQPGDGRKPDGCATQ